MQHVIGIGELLWDVLPDGKKLGGAPCNFVYHAQKQGANGLVLSAIGDDKSGKEILELIKLKNISSSLIQVNDKPTSTVDVQLDKDGVPAYTIHKNVAWDFIRFDGVDEKKITQANILCFGSLAQRNSTSRNTIEKILKLSNHEALIVCDINLRQNFYNKEIVKRSLRLCNVLKLNEDELPIVCDFLNIEITNEEEQILSLIKTYDLKLVAFTKGGKDSLLMSPTDRSFIKTQNVKVKDKVGAGDSFTATMMIEFFNGNPLKIIRQKAVEISAFVCTQDGAMPEYN